MSSLLAIIGITLSLAACLYYSINPNDYSDYLLLLGIGASMVGLSLWLEDGEEKE